jgi:DNA ligase-1
MFGGRVGFMQTELMKFPTLFKKTSTGALQQWTIRAEGDSIVTEWGQVGGAIQTGMDIIKAGKNMGRSNETTAIQQAQAEAESQWQKKVKKGYVPSLAAARKGEVDTDVIEGGIFPMLAHKFSEQGHKIKYPAFAQPKFDGHRCVAVVKDGVASLWSRTRKPITGLPHLIEALEELASTLDDPNLILDGELYNHDYRNKFEEPTSFIRNPEPKPGHEVVQYHVYDFPCGRPLGFEDRNRDLGMLLTENKSSALVKVRTLIVFDEDELMDAFDKFLAEGYEGAMARNGAGLYVNKRSYDLQKIKEFDSSEFIVVGVEEGRGKLAGHAIFVCKTVVSEASFRVKMKGETKELKKYFDDPSLAIGRQLEVKYQGITNKSGVPRFPVALRFRDEV